MSMMLDGFLPLSVSLFFNPCYGYLSSKLVLCHLTFLYEYYTLVFTLSHGIRASGILGLISSCITSYFFD
jgi:hypothetical protein